MRIFAIGDIHGQLALLRAAHARIAARAGDDAKIVHLGDLIDRGPDSRGVIDYLMQGQSAGRDWIVIRGNHDTFLPRYLEDPSWADPGLSTPAVWTEHPGLGAAETLASYGIDPSLPPDALHRAARVAIPQAHADWLAARPLWHLSPLALFVHAGVRPGVGLLDQTETDLTWIRKPFHTSTDDHGVLVVHGHTPVKRPTHYGNRVNIDTGAAYGGPLTAIEISPSGITILDDERDIPLPAPTD